MESFKNDVAHRYAHSKRQPADSIAHQKMGELSIEGDRNSFHWLVNYAESKLIQLRDEKLM